MPEYQCWRGIIQRCEKESAIGFANYGGRGITLCAEWRRSFAAFLQHIGPRPSPEHEVDRIDNNRGYEPGNVRWATRREQANNRRTNRPIVGTDGVAKTIAEWSRETGVRPDTILWRIQNGWNEMLAVRTPALPFSKTRNGDKRGALRAEIKGGV